MYCVILYISMDANRKKHTIILASVAGGLALLWALLLLLRLSPAVAEFVCRYIARPWIFVVGHINAIFPFSVFEFFVLAAIGGGIALLVLAIVGLCKKRGGTVCKGACIVLVCVLGVCNLYTLLAGFAYYRRDAPVPQSETEFTSQQVTAMAQYFADDYNALAASLPRDAKGNVVSPYTLRELSDAIAKEYKRLGKRYFYGYAPPAKPVLNSWFLTLNGITGVTFVPLGEPTVNRSIPPSDLPQTVAHEMAHALGVAREGEANFVSYYVLLSSQDDYLRYCGYFATFHSLLSAVNADSSNKSDYLQIAQNMQPCINVEQRNAYRFWNEKTEQPGFAGWLHRTGDKIGNFFNNLFLKSNGADNGNDSYVDKVTDGEITDTGTTDPDTGDIIYDVTYSSVQKMYFSIYESAVL